MRICSDTRLKLSVTKADDRRLKQSDHQLLRRLGFYYIQHIAILVTISITLIDLFINYKHTSSVYV